MVGRTHRLSASVRLRLLYEDRTRFGSPLTERCDDTLRAALAPIVEEWNAREVQSLVARSPRLLEALASNVLPGARLGRAPLPEQFLYPDPAAVTPSALVVLGPRGVELGRAPLVPEVSRELASWLGAWERGAARPAAGAAADLWDRFEALGVLEPWSEGQERSPAVLGDATLIGHASVRIASAGSSVLFDPLLFPRSPAYPAGYQPLDHRDVPAPDAVFLTHSHPDHFDLGTLLRFGAQTPVFVPVVPRESVLAIDLGARLEEVGFTRVTRLAWGDRARVGGVEVVALPFYGEQPAVDEVLHPEVRNLGNTYLVEAGGRRLALTVDSGRDPAGDVRRVAADARAKYGELDVLFGGYRGFALYPVHFLFSSVARFLPFVPESRWGVRQQIMSDAEATLDTAELWGARVLVPYADGGAPWFWEEGLGPRLDGTEEPRAAVDPAPEHVRAAAEQRSASPSRGLIASPSRVLILRPGDSLSYSGEGAEPEVVRPAPWPWPAAIPPATSTRPAGQGSTPAAPEAGELSRCGETFAVVRKKILLRLLAREHAERLGLDVTEDELRRRLREYRAAYGLESKAEAQRFLDEEGLSLEDLLDVLRDAALVEALEERLRAEIAALERAQVSSTMARERHRERVARARAEER